MSDTILAAVIGGFFATVSALGAVWFGHCLSRRARGSQPKRADEAEPIVERADSELDKKAEPEQTREREALPSPPAHPQQHPPLPDGVVIPKLVAGFFIAILAALFWGVGNAVTRWTAEQYPTSSFDVALLKYVVAGISLLVIGLIRRRKTHATAPVFSALRGARPAAFVGAGLAKGLNTYLWIAAVSLISATTVATLENMHAVWTALILAVFLRAKIPGGWAVSAIVVVIGGALVTGIATQGIGNFNMIGLLLGLGAGLSFAIFTIVWTGEGGRPEFFWQRSIEMGVLLLLCAVLIYPIHLALRPWLGGEVIPLMNLPFEHAFVQGVNGLVGIGLTYLLLNESLSLMRDAGKMASLLLSLGISFAVVFTLITEAIWFEIPVSPSQWLGIVLFTIGFTAVRSNLMQLGRNHVARQDETDS